MTFKVTYTTWSPSCKNSEIKSTTSKTIIFSYFTIRFLGFIELSWNVGKMIRLYFDEMCWIDDTFIWVPRGSRPSWSTNILKRFLLPHAILLFSSFFCHLLSQSPSSVTRICLLFPRTESFHPWKSRRNSALIIHSPRSHSRLTIRWNWFCKL